MSDDTHRKSNLYAFVQSALIVIFAGVFFFVPGRRLFAFPGAVIVGNVLSVAGLILMAAAFVPLRKVIQVSPEPRAEGHLVTSGIYARLRHPIYTGIVLLIIGLFLREPGLFVAVSGFMVIAFLLIKSRFEERLLAERYAEYAQYRTRTWGVLPGM